MSPPQTKTEIRTECYAALQPAAACGVHTVRPGLIIGVTGASSGAARVPGLSPRAGSGTREGHTPFFFEEEIGMSESIE